MSVLEIWYIGFRIGHVKFEVLVILFRTFAMQLFETSLVGLNLHIVLFHPCSTNSFWITLLCWSSLLRIFKA